MEGPLRITGTWEVPAGELHERFSRSSGPGGQGVNTTDSRVELTIDLANAASLPDHLRSRVLVRLSGRLVDGVLRVTASEHRSQRQNRTAARRRLARLLREAAAPPAPTRRPTRPTLGSQRRRLETKKRRSRTKSDRGVDRRGQFD